MLTARLTEWPMVHGVFSALSKNLIATFMQWDDLSLLRSRRLLSITTWHSGVCAPVRPNVGRFRPCQLDTPPHLLCDAYPKTRPDAQRLQQVKLHISIVQN